MAEREGMLIVCSSRIRALNERKKYTRNCWCALFSDVGTTNDNGNDTLIDILHSCVCVYTIAFIVFLLDTGAVVVVAIHFIYRFRFCYTIHTIRLNSIAHTQPVCFSTLVILNLVRERVGSTVAAAIFSYLCFLCCCL